MEVAEGSIQYRIMRMEWSQHLGCDLPLNLLILTLCLGVFLRDRKMRSKKYKK